MKKILFFIAEDYSVLSHRLALLKMTRELGYEVVVATKVSNHKEQLESEGFKVIPIKNLHRSGLNPFKDLKLLHELFQIYRTEKPDTSYHVAFKPVIYGGLAALLTRVPHVIYALGGLGTLYLGQSLKVKIVRFAVNRIFSLLFHRKNSSLILQNDDDAKSITGLFPPKQLHMIRGSGVDINYYSPTPEPKGSIVITMAARLLWDKGVGELIDAARLIKEKQKDIQIHLYGEPDPENPNSVSLHELKNWHEEGIIQWHGPAKDSREAYRNCHIAVLPSYREGLPKGLLEAAASGRPIVTTDVPGCKDTVIDGVSGYIVPVKNANMLADRLLDLANSPNKRAAFGKRGRSLVEEQFSDTFINTQLTTVIKNSSQ